MQISEAVITSFSIYIFFTSYSALQSTLSKTDTFGTGTKCPSQRDVRLIESNKGNKQRQGPTLSVRFTEGSVTEVSVKRELTLFSNRLSSATGFHQAWSKRTTHLIKKLQLWAQKGMQWQKCFWCETSQHCRLNWDASDSLVLHTISPTIRRYGRKRIRVVRRENYLPPEIVATLGHRNVKKRQADKQKESRSNRCNESGRLIGGFSKYKVLELERFIGSFKIRKMTSMWQFY